MIAAGMPHIDTNRKERLEKFSRYASILPWFNIDTLHKLYLNIFEKKADRKVNVAGYHLRAITCADLIHSPQVDRIGYNTFIMQTDIQNSLRNELTAMENGKEILVELGKFMLSYTEKCREHFPSPKHLESFRIEGNSIVDPAAEAERVIKNIVNRFNQQGDTDKKKKAVAYYLKVLDQNNLTPQQKKLVDFLNMYQKLDSDINQINEPDLEQFKSFLPKESKPAETITLKLRSAFKKNILDRILETPTNKPTLHALIVGIDNYPEHDNVRRQSAVTDAKTIERYLVQNLSQGCKLEPYHLFNEEANYNSVEHYFKTKLFKEIKPDDTFVCYFAGQGGTFEVKDPSGARLSSDLLNTAMAKFSGNPALKYRKIMGLLLSDSTTYSIFDLLNHLGSFPSSCNYTLLLDTDFTHDLETKQIDLDSANGIGQAIYELDVPKGIMITADSTFKSASQESRYHSFGNDMLQALQNERNTVKNGNLIDIMNASYISFNGNQKVALSISDSSLMNAEFLFGFLKNPYSESLKLIEENKRSKEETLDLKNKGLNRIPGEIFDLEHLRVLDLSDNNIEGISEGLAKLIDLEELNLANNENLSHIDFDFGKLKKLRVLKFSNCSLQVFPKSILKLDQLEELELAATDLRIIPNALGNLRHLQKLDLTDNEIVNFDIAHLEENHVECLRTLPSIEDADDMSRPMALIVGMDYYDKLRHMVTELEEIGEICERAGLEVVKVFNPTGSALNKIIHRYQKRLSILHFASFKMDLISIENDKVRDLRPYGWVEFFRCIKPERFDTPLLFLNCCYAEDIIKPLLDEHVFKLGIGIKDEIDEGIAYRFGVNFYNALIADGMNISDALSYTEGTLDHS